MREPAKNCTREPGTFRNRITNEQVTAMQWRKWNAGYIEQWLSDSADLCSYELDNKGILRLYTGFGALRVEPMDWIVWSTSGINTCSASIFDQVCEELK